MLLCQLPVPPRKGVRLLLPCRRRLLLLPPQLDGLPRCRPRCCILLRIFPLILLFTAAAAAALLLLIIPLPLLS